jgi:hypothetical protein
MSAFQKKIEITENERKAIECMTVVRENMDTKLLLCMLETLQEMKQEIRSLKESNEEMKVIFQSITKDLWGTSKKALITVDKEVLY